MPNSVVKSKEFRLVFLVVGVILRLGAPVPTSFSTSSSAPAEVVRNSSLRGMAEQRVDDDVPELGVMSAQEIWRRLRALASHRISRPW